MNKKEVKPNIVKKKKKVFQAKNSGMESQTQESAEVSNKNESQSQQSPEVIHQKESQFQKSPEVISKKEPHEEQEELSVSFFPMTGLEKGNELSKQMEEEPSEEVTEKKDTLNPHQVLCVPCLKLSNVVTGYTLVMKYNEMEFCFGPYENMAFIRTALVEEVLTIFETKEFPQENYQELVTACVNFIKDELKKKYSLLVQYEPQGEPQEMMPIVKRDIRDLDEDYFTSLYIEDAFQSKSLFLNQEDLWKMIKNQ